MKLSAFLIAIYLVFAVSGDPQNGDLRLVDSSGGFIGNSGGRVEIYLNGNWGVIQQYLQSDQTSDWAAAANTICRQQGYDHANGYGPVAKYDIPASTLDPLLNSITCQSESYTPNAPHHILRCFAIFNGISNHSLDLAVDCDTGGVYQPYDTQVRLVDGRTGFPSSGFVELYINGRWGPVCHMNQKASDTTCRQLGYTNAVNYGSASAIFIDSTQVDTISCSSTGPCLRNCFNYPSTDHAIICSQYSYVNCTYDMNSDVTLYDGSETLCTIVVPHNIITLAVGIAVALFIAIIVCIIIGVSVCCCIPGCILYNSRRRVVYQTISS